jgi:hypothetical protein
VATPVKTNDTCVTIHPYFKVPDGNMSKVKALCEQFMAKSSQEPKCLYYGFSFTETEMFCREGYEGAEGLLAHLENVGALLGEALKIGELFRLEVHGTEAELAKLREPLAAMNPVFFTLEYGFRR